MAPKSKSLKALFGAVLLMCFMILFLFSGVLTNAATIKINILSKIAKGREKSDPNFVSKRRVPTGPDPIHNRRAGKYRQQPGRI